MTSPPPARSESVAIFNVYLFAMKRCLIATKIAGSIGILLCCVLNDFFHTGAWTFARFVRPLLAAILCIMWNLVPAYTCITYFPVCKKSASSHQFWSRPLTRNSRFFCIMFLKLENEIVWSYFWVLSKSSRCFGLRWKHFEILHLGKTCSIFNNDTNIIMENVQYWRVLSSVETPRS